MALSDLFATIDRYRLVASPIGDLVAAGNADGLLYLGFPKGPMACVIGDEWRRDNNAFAAETDEIDAYFQGDLTSFSMPPSPFGSEFQRRVWMALKRIPYGETTTYGQIAEAIGKKGAARAIGSANHVNPLPILIPCHRVIGSNGELTGFGGGLDIKARLLKFEAANRDRRGFELKPAG